MSTGAFEMPIITTTERKRPSPLGATTSQKHTAGTEANPPIMTQRPQNTTRHRGGRKPKNSALGVISASIQPLSNEPDLLDVLCYMKDENDVAGMLGLYDGFVAIAEVANGHLNLPRVIGRGYGCFESESERAWAKAYLVADFLKEMRPDRYNSERYAATLFKCTLAMGNNLCDAVAVVNEIVSWQAPR
jgi:hypothetical protein